MRSFKLALDPSLVTDLLRLDAMDKVEHQTLRLKAASPVRPEPDLFASKEFYRIAPGGVAVIPFEGFVCEREEIWDYYFGGAASTEVAGEALDIAMSDEEVRKVLFAICSPGGYASAAWPLAEKIWTYRGKKPLIAYAATLCCSAAYDIASQCDQFFTGGSADFGSIGIYAAGYGRTRLLENIGVKPWLLRSGTAKGIGANGMDLSEADQAEIQRSIDALAAGFLKRVARGRGISLEAARAAAGGEAGGRVYNPEPPALAGGEPLFDGVRQLSELITELGADAVVLPPPGLTEPLGPPAPEPNPTEARRRADSPRKENPMDRNEVDQIIAAALTPLNLKITGLEDENKVLRSQLEATAKSAIESAQAQGLARLIAEARGQTGKPPKVAMAGPAAEFAVEMIGKLFAVDAKAAQVYVDNMAPLGKGKVVFNPTSSSTASGAPAQAARHRFDTVGPEKWQTSTDPLMVAYGERISWIAEREAGGQKFPDSLTAHNAARAALAKTA